jgi:hypothetical protein
MGERSCGERTTRDFTRKSKRMSFPFVLLEVKFGVANIQTLRRRKIEMNIGGGFEIIGDIEFGILG